VFNATFNNNSAILWRSVLLVKEIRVPGEYHYSLQKCTKICTICKYFCWQQMFFILYYCTQTFW